MAAMGRGRVKSQYPDENEQSCCSEDGVSEVFAMLQPRATTLNFQMIADSHLFTRPRPKPVTPRCLPEYLRRVGRGKGTFRAAARANRTRRSTDDGRPKVAPSSYRFSTPMPLSAFVSTVSRCPCAAGSPERFRSRGMQSASCGAGGRRGEPQLVRAAGRSAGDFD